MLNRTAFGRHVYATGDDPEAARLAGINTDRMLLAVYALAGLICAIAGWVLIGRIGAVSPLAGRTANLDSITAVVIGGTSLFGGRGSIVGTLIGALIVGVFRNGLALAGARRALAGIRRRRADHRRRHASTSGSGRSRHERGRDRPAARSSQARGLVKRYGRVMALDHADFDLMPDEILGGHRRQRRRQVDADQGAVRRGDPRSRARSAWTASRSISARRSRPAHAGIETVYQNLALSPALSIADNLFLGRERREAGLLGRAASACSTAPAMQKRGARSSSTSSAC